MLYGDARHEPERLLRPLVREGGGRRRRRLVETTWDAAIDLVARRVAPLPGKDVLALWYGGSMGLVQRRFPLRTMNALGATLHDGGICDATSTAGYECVLGRCVGPDIESIEGADLVLCGAPTSRAPCSTSSPRCSACARRASPSSRSTSTAPTRSARSSAGAGAGSSSDPAPTPRSRCASRASRSRSDSPTGSSWSAVRRRRGVRGPRARAAHDVEETERITGLSAQVDRRARAPAPARARARS
jgi:hypothetical protein